MFKNFQKERRNQKWKDLYQDTKINQNNEKTNIDTFISESSLLEWGNTSKYMSKEEAQKRYNAVRSLLSSGDGWVQMNDEGETKYFLTWKVKDDLKRKVEDIIRAK
jgi:hypothetical protein